MNKKQLISRVVSELHGNGISKRVSVPKQVFHISDDEGNQKDFIIRSVDKTVNFNSTDVGSIIDITLSVIEEALKQGEEVALHGFGTFGLHHRAPSRTKLVGTDEWININARYIPKFSFGNNLKLAAKLYELSLSDSVNNEFTEEESGD
jgi:DNA-binding protein HU-beta